MSCKHCQCLDCVIDRLAGGGWRINIQNNQWNNFNPYGQLAPKPFDWHADHLERQAHFTETVNKQRGY